MGALSVRVELAGLAEEVSRFGPTPFLVTVGADGRPHAVSVHVGWDGDRLVLRAGNTTVANAKARPSVMLLWSPVEGGGFSLIVDGTAEVDGTDRVLIGPTAAVLHRQVSDGPGDAPVASCQPVFNH